MEPVAKQGGGETGTPAAATPGEEPGKKKKKKKKVKKTSVWSEHKAPDGRLYYYNNELKTSSWQKPDELKTKAEVGHSSTLWKVIVSSIAALYQLACDLDSK